MQLKQTEEDHKETNHAESMRQINIIDDQVQRLSAQVEKKTEEISVLEAAMDKIRTEYKQAVFWLACTPVIILFVIYVFFQSLWFYPIVWVLGDIGAAIGLLYWMKHWIKRILLYKKNIIGVTEKGYADKELVNVRLYQCRQEKQALEAKIRELTQ